MQMPISPQRLGQRLIVFIFHVLLIHQMHLAHFINTEQDVATLCRYNVSQCQIDIILMQVINLSVQLKLIIYQLINQQSIFRVGNRYIVILILRLPRLGHGRKVSHLLFVFTPLHYIIPITIIKTIHLPKILPLPHLLILIKQELHLMYLIE